MNIKKTWALEYWRDGRVVYIHTFEDTPEQAVITRNQAQSAASGNCRVMLVLLHSAVLAEA